MTTAFIVAAALTAHPTGMATPDLAGQWHNHLETHCHGLNFAVTQNIESAIADLDEHLHWEQQMFRIEGEVDKMQVTLLNSEEACFDVAWEIPDTFNHSDFQSITSSDPGRIRIWVRYSGEEAVEINILITDLPRHNNNGVDGLQETMRFVTLTGNLKLTEHMKI